MECKKRGHPRCVPAGKPGCCEVRKTAALERKLLKAHRSRMDLSKERGQRQKIIFNSLVVMITDNTEVDTFFQEKNVK